MGPYIPAYTGGIMLSNGVTNLPFNLIGTPQGPSPVLAGTKALFEEFIAQLKQVG